MPSKALLASAKAADTIRHAYSYGLQAKEPEIDTSEVFRRIRAIQDQIAESDDNADRFIAMGVDVHFGAARLTGPNIVEVDGVGALWSRYVLLCTGSRPAVPAIPGLEDAGYLTSETFWDAERAPVSLVALGGGPTSVEIAQALARLGVLGTLLENDVRILTGDEPALAGRLAERLQADGVDLVTDVEVQSVAVQDGLKVVSGVVAGEPHEWRGQGIFVGVGLAAEPRWARARGRGCRDGPARRAGQPLHANEREVDLRDRRRGRAISLHPLRGVRGISGCTQHVLPGGRRRRLTSFPGAPTPTPNSPTRG